MVTAVATPALYDVRISHTRRSPLHNSFEYGAYLWLVDLDDVAAGRLVRGRPLPRWLRGQARFEAADHVGDPAASIKDNVLTVARAHGIEDVHRVLMLGSARSGVGRLSHVFNPLTVHWCHRADGTLACLVAEVHNTYGGRHVYVLHPDEAGRAQTDKRFYVSPFLEVGGRYLMRFSPPGERLLITMALRQGGSTPFTARIEGTARPATTRAVLGAVLRRPMMSLRVSALIRLQGGKLWLRRLPVVPRTTDDVRTPAGTRS
jgi:uncharacterized protein